MKNLSPPSPHFNDEKKKARFGLRANSSLIWGEGGFISHFILSKIQSRSKQMKNLSPPSPHFNDEKKKARFGLRANSSLIWGEGGFISHFILSKIVVLLACSREEPLSYSLFSQKLYDYQSLCSIFQLRASLPVPDQILLFPVEWHPVLLFLHPFLEKLIKTTPFTVHAHVAHI